MDWGILLSSDLNYQMLLSQEILEFYISGPILSIRSLMALTLFRLAAWVDFRVISPYTLLYFHIFNLRILGKHSGDTWETNFNVFFF